MTFKLHNMRRYLSIFTAAWKSNDLNININDPKLTYEEHGQVENPRNSTKIVNSYVKYASSLEVSTGTPQNNSDRDISTNSKLIKMVEFPEKKPEFVEKPITLLHNLSLYRNDPWKAWESYRIIIDNNLIKFMTNEHIRQFLGLLCNNPNNMTFEWLSQVMKDILINRQKRMMDSVLYANVLQSLTGLGDATIVADMIRQMTLLGYYVEQSHVKNILAQCSDFESAYKIIDAVIASHPEANCEWYHIIICMYCEKGNTDAAINTLRLYNLSGQRPRIKFYSVIIHELCRKDEMKVAEELVDELTSFFGPPNEVMYNSLISGYNRRNDMNMVTEVYSKMIESGVQPRRSIYTTLIFANLRQRDIYDASKLYKSIMEQDLKHNRYLFIALIYLRGILADSDGAREVFEKMKVVGIIPDIMSYNQLIFAHDRDEKVDVSKIEALYLEILSENLTPNRYTFELLIDALSRRGEYSKIPGVFREISNRNVPITSAAFNSPIRHLSLAGNTEIAWKFFNRMISAGIEPDLYTYSSIISLAVADSDFEVAIKAFKDLLSRRLTPNVYVYSAIITSLAKSGYPNHAIAMLNHMNSQGVIPNVVTFTALIQGFKFVKNYEKGRKVYEIMKRSNVIPDRMTYYHLEKLYKITRHADEIPHLHEDMRKYGINPNSHGRILTKGKGSFYWRSRFLINRRIERQKAAVDPEEQYEIKKRQRSLWKWRNKFREKALRRLYAKLRRSGDPKPYPEWKKKYIRENFLELQRYKRLGMFPF
ncbi:8113_t:CDS:1 [Acaulospora morrowiae]|uniref:8113_t:CDS:1 n=1 Tax=Acaulospora morrowiae TaxID=94023 RepID=A0A9N9CP04_9GLOM|nr:8113_t:CDS:1 [Acaulospora morrowiae]